MSPWPTPRQSILDCADGANEEFRTAGDSAAAGDAPRAAAAADHFGQALFLHATVVHCNRESGKRVLDCGSKACDFVSGMPSATSIDDPQLAARLAVCTFKSGGDEHGILGGVASEDLPVGATVQLVPSHCDPTGACLARCPGDHRLASVCLLPEHHLSIAHSQPARLDCWCARWRRRADL